MSRILNKGARGTVRVAILIALLASASCLMLTQSHVLTAMAQATMGVVLNVNQYNFTIRETVVMSGNVTIDGVLLPEGLVALEVDDSLGSPAAMRTIPTGTFSPPTPTIDITFVSPYSGSPPMPTLSLYAGDRYAGVQVNITNTDAYPHPATVGVTIYDSSLIAIGAGYMAYSGEGVPPHTTIPIGIPVAIPEWSTIGGAVAVASVYSALPSDGGYPYCLEKTRTFNITRTPETVVFEGPNINTPSPAGYYNASFKLSPESRNGTYTVYAIGREASTMVMGWDSGFFGVTSTGIPPQASFAFSPPSPVINENVRFDGSGSSAEGYADFITKYEWDFGDGAKTTGKIAYHPFAQNITYTVALNVTDNEGLWCVTMKPVKIIEARPPTANFTWSQSGNLTVRFDASISLPGRNGLGATPIVSYTWNFGDANITTIATPVITHKYALEANYSVTLTVNDTQGLTNSMVQTVEARILLRPPWDINQDGFVNAKDAVILGTAFGTQTGGPGYNAAADINGDGFINAKDAVILGTHFGESYP